MRRRIVVVGHAHHRRVREFVAACASLDVESDVVSHLELLRGSSRLADIEDGDVHLRIESTGQDPGVERALLRRGYAAARAAGVWTQSPEELEALDEQRGRVLPPRQHHLGFVDYLGELEAIIEQRPAWTVWSPPSSIRELFDKRVTSRRYAAAGLPVPESIDLEATEPDALRDAMSSGDITSAYVKLSCGSSASCLALVRRQPDGSEAVMTTLTGTPERWFNTRRVRRIADRRQADEVLGFLLRQGSQVERSISKARLPGGFIDLRVLMCAGEPAFMVVRQSTHAITNLHLGGRRGDLESLRRAVPDDAWRSAMQTCRRVAAMHGCHHLGIDLLFEPGFVRHRIIEANAFGDLLPGLQRDGLDVYQWQVRAALELAG